MFLHIHRYLVRFFCALISLHFITFSTALKAQAVDAIIDSELWADDLEILQYKGIEFRGGLEYSLRDSDQSTLLKPLKSTDLGGFSTIEFVHQGEESPRFIAFSDNNGLWIEMSLSIKEGMLNGVHLSRMGTLIDPQTNEGLEDIESMAGNGSGLFLAFENSGKLWELDNLDSKPKISWPIKGMKGFSQNGIESLTLLGDKRLLAIAELQSAGNDFVSSSALGSLSRKQTRAGWLETGKHSGVFNKLAIRRRGRLDPGGSTTLSGGDVLVLFKHYNLLTGINHIAIELINTRQLEPGVVVAGDVLLDVRSKRRHQRVLDNMEGISSFEYEGATYILIASDDNLHWPRQKNRLLLFRLEH